MSLALANKKTAISVRKDVNSTTKPGIIIRKVLLDSLPIQLRSRPTFNPSGTFTTDSLLDFSRKLAYDWFPSNNLTVEPESAGDLVVNGQAVGKMDIVVIPGQTITDSRVSDELFSQTKDIASAWMIVKGDLVLEDCEIRPSQRKLFTVVYVTGNLTMNSSGNPCSISMTQRGANHSGTGDSGGATTAVDIKVGPNTTITASGGAGAATNNIPGTAASGTNGRDDTQSALGSGGGGGGWNDTNGVSVDPATMGSGAAGTCFSGGAGGGGSADPADSTTSGSAGANGGAGGTDINGTLIDEGAAGAGNPNGGGARYSAFDGTGGTLIVIVQGTISTNTSGSLFTANGTRGPFFSVDVNYYSTPPFGGGSGGGIVIVAAQNGTSFTSNVSAAGGGSQVGPTAGNGAAVAYNLSAL